MCLRDSRGCSSRQGSRRAYSVGGGSESALSSVVVTPAALLPERFRGGCAFGGCHCHRQEWAALSRGDRSTLPAACASRRALTSGASALGPCRTSMARVNAPATCRLKGRDSGAPRRFAWAAAVATGRRGQAARILARRLSTTFLRPATRFSRSPWCSPPSMHSVCIASIWVVRTSGSAMPVAPIEEM
jgi:hypothetical protein